MLAPVNSERRWAMDNAATTKHDWSTAEIAELFERPFMDLLYQAQTVHRQSFVPNTIQLSTLLSIKTGGCTEDCKYCSQSTHHNSDLEPERLLEVEEVVEKAREAKDSGATRYCMGAAWRSPSGRSFDRVLDMVRGVKELGLETCATLGMLSPDQAGQLKSAGLDYYNHNIDTSPEYYAQVISTRTFEDRLDTLSSVREAGVKVCCGGIVGMGERRSDRIELLRTLANLPQHPESVPINMLVQVKGTPLENTAALSPIEFVRTIAVARILMPHSYVRLSAGRTEMSDSTQALSFLAGANSIFTGAKLLTTPNPGDDRDSRLFADLGLQPQASDLE